MRRQMHVNSLGRIEIDPMITRRFDNHRDEVLKSGISL